MKTIQEFIDEQGLTFSYKQIDERRDGLMNEVPMRHYRTWIGKDSERMMVTYSQGMGIDHNPKLEDVLNSLALDIGGILSNRNFEEWCSEFGYDAEDFRKATRIWHGCMREREGLERLIGKEAVEELVFEVEQL
jgi:hypothetical protein